MNLSKFIETLKLVAPIIVAAVPQGKKYGDLIIAGVALAETSTKKGSDKKAIALEAVKTAAIATNTLSGEVKIDVDAAIQVADDTIDTIVAFVNDSIQIVDNAELVNVGKTVDPLAGVKFN